MPAVGIAVQLLQRERGGQVAPVLFALLRGTAWATVSQFLLGSSVSSPVVWRSKASAPSGHRNRTQSHPEIHSAPAIQLDRHVRLWLSSFRNGGYYVETGSNKAVLGDQRPTCRLHRRQARSPYRPAGRKGIIPAGIEDDDIQGGASLHHAGEYPLR